MPHSLCYLCQSNTPRFAFAKHGYNILQCPHCHLYTLEFNADYDKFIRRYYNRNFFIGSDNRIGYADYEGDLFAEKINMTRYLHRISQFKPSGTLLDVGCATGLFMQKAQQFGFNVYGFDVSAYATRIAQKRHPGRVKLTTVSEARYQLKYFDVITLFDVIEHLQDPRQDLKNLKKFLKPDGMLVINTGDASSLLAHLQGKSWHYFSPPQHLFFFSRSTLTTLLQQAGFEVLAIHPKGKWISLRYLLNLMKQIHHNPFAAYLYPRVKDSLVGKVPLYLNLFDNIIVYARQN